MAFGWVIRHQKKALFILAVVLIVGWVLTLGPGSRLLGLGGSSRSSGAVASIAGEDVNAAQFQAFRRNWTQVFPDLFRAESIRRYYGDETISPLDVTWAWYGLWTLARQNGLQVDDAMVLEVKRQLYRNWTGGRGTVLDDQAERFFRDQIGVSSRHLDEIIREFLMAQRMLGYILGGLEATSAEAWEEYARENRAVRVRAVAFPSSSFLAKVSAPDNATVQAWYDSHKGTQGDYYTAPTVQIEYAQILLSKLEADATVTTEDMKTWYEANKDLYKMPAAKEGQEAEYLPFPEVKPEIEGILKRQAVGERAAKLMDDLRAAFAAAPAQATLEDVLKAKALPAVEYFRTPFLTEMQLIDLPGIGTAHAEGAGLVQLAFTADPLKRELSPVLGSTEGRWVFRLMAPPHEGSVPDLADIRARVVEDVRRHDALKLATDAAAAFDNVVSASGADRFDALAAQRGLSVVETPFFINNLFDANRPDYIDRESPLKVGVVYGPWVSGRDGVAAVVRVAEERLADRAGFAGEEKIKRAYVLASKTSNYPRFVMPRPLLQVLKFKHLQTAAPAADNAVTPPADNATTPPAATPVPDNTSLLAP